MVFSTNPPFDFSGPQENNCMLAEEKEELLVFKERGSSVMHRAAFPAACRKLAWVFTALMLKHPHCSTDPLELIVQIWMSLVCVQHGPSVGVCSCYWCLALCPWAPRLMAVGWHGLPVLPSPGFLYYSQICKNLFFLTSSQLCRKKKTILLQCDVIATQSHPHQMHGLSGIRYSPQGPVKNPGLALPWDSLSTSFANPKWSPFIAAQWDRSHTGPNQSTFKSNFFIF